jgi:hypothetical protein
MVFGAALVQYAFQLALVLLAQLLYANYGCVRSRATSNVYFSTKFRRATNRAAAASCRRPVRSLRAVDCKSMLERCRARTVVSLENDLATVEIAYFYCFVLLFWLPFFLNEFFALALIIVLN